ncbi:MAG: hypothetical protein U1F71_02810 [Verrucomicrobiaceae bacterium]
MKRFPKVRVLVCSGLLLAVSTPFSVPAQQPDAFPSVEAIPVRPDSRLEKDFRAEERNWARTVLLKAARDQWNGREWAANAENLMEATFEQIEKEHAVAHPLAPLSGRFRELLAKAPDDPVLAVFGAQALFDDRGDWLECMPLIEKALSKGGMSGVVEAMAHQLRWNVAEAELLNDNEDAKHQASARWLVALARSLADGSYDKDSLGVLVRHHVRALRTLEPADLAPLEEYSRQVESSMLDEWAKLTLRGVTEVEIAWMKRSSKWANNVTEAQWKGFADHLKNARDLLGRAVRLRPDRPEAASLMIPVAMGENVDFNELRAWFNRAVTAQFDYMPAYKNLLWAYRPRWGGDLQLMLAFGKACAETKRYDTQVPLTLITASIDVTDEIGNPKPVFRHPETRTAMAEMCRGYLQAAASAAPLTRHQRLSHVAMSAWLADEDKLAQQALEAAGPRLHPETRQLLATVMLHEPMMRAEIAADTGAYGEAIRAATNPPPKSKLEDIHAAFMKVEETGLSQDALTYLREAREMTGLPAAVEAGGWVDLHFYKHLTAFYQNEHGDWQVDADGVLVSRGTGHPRSRLALRVPVAQDLEIKGEIAFDVPAEIERLDTSLGIGPMFCWTPAATAGLKAMIFYLSRNSACTKAYSTTMQRSTPDIVIGLKEWNSFSMRRVGDKLTYEINDRPIATSVDLNQLELDSDQGLIGFSAYRLPVGSSARIRNVSIRKITAAELAPKASPQTAGALPPSPGTLPDWTWKAALIGVMALVAIFIPRFMPNRED